ncbi:PREDICTED: uncharacterized protein LOC102873303 [Elephantulus edwardii]|uniref:uncharacterized protein LOC102873303 n=1 Tax=Elephantulus edwardii TaxID=28737 RepID=UPI0003F0BE73|nr:PREDICTED: uncharacterized protein LOC102873303 [Elephantulus edwardii]
MLLLCGSLLCWALLHQVQGEAQHQLHMQISNNQLETGISDLFLNHKILERVEKIPVTGTESEGVAILDNLPFVKEDLSKQSSGLDLSLVGDLLSGKKLSMLAELIRGGGLIIEDAKGPTVNLKILEDSLLQVTLRCKLYLLLQGILRLEIIKNIRIGMRLEQTGNKTKVAFEECHTSPGYLSIKVLEEIDPLLVNTALTLVTKTLDTALPFLLQKIVCPMSTTLLNTLLEGLLHLTLPPTSSSPNNAFRYYVNTTELTEEAILMTIQLVTPCGPGQRAPKSVHLPSKPLPKLARDSMADLVFWGKVYNNILFCLYTNETIRVDPHDSTAINLIQLLLRRELQPESKVGDQTEASVGLTINISDPPTIHLDNHVITVTQPGLLVLQGPQNALTSISWKLHSEAVFSTRNRKLNIQFNPNSLTITLGSYPDDLVNQEYLKSSLSELLKKMFLAQFNEQLRKQALPLPNIKGIPFDHAQMVSSEGYLMLMVSAQ